jgi:hypothetical protein
MSTASDSTATALVSIAPFRVVYDKCCPFKKKFVSVAGDLEPSLNMDFLLNRRLDLDFLAPGI